MNHKVLPLFKSHYSLGRSVITLDPPSDKEYPTSIFNLLKKHNLHQLVLIEDGVTGIIEASQNCEKNKIDLFFGLRITVCSDMDTKDENSIKSEAKYIIFVKNTEGYKDLIKISTASSTRGFYYVKRIDFPTLKSLWNENNLKLAIPFYDSFLFLNTLESHIHVPELSFTKPVLFIEDNDLPFDYIIKDKVENYAKDNGLETVQAQSIYYSKPEDFISYLTVRCINGRTTLEKPNLSHMGSHTFSFQRWTELNK